jgi:lysophospholipid acyltransferase (LPLAT)-like uncharacterized protein
VKIRHPLLTAAIGSAGAFLLRRWIGTLKIHASVEQQGSNPFEADCSANMILALWHEGLLMPTVEYGRLNQYTLISQSQDGEYIARIAENLGLQVIRGSSSRGAVAALKQLVEVSTTGRRVHVAITADGPRGPRRVLKEGPIYLASRAGMGIIPTGVAYERPWRAKSWDRFAIPRPFTHAVMVGRPPVFVPADADRDALNHYRSLVQAEMELADERAHEILRSLIAGEAIPESTSRRAA